MIVSFKYITSFIGGFSGGVGLSMLVGIIWIFVFSTIIRSVFIHRDAVMENQRIFFWYGIIFFGLFACFMGIISRTYISPNEGVTARYMVFRFMLYAPLIPLIYITKNYLPQYLKTISYALFAIVSALMIANLFNYVNNVSNEQLKLNVGISEFRNDAMSYNDNILYIPGVAETQYLIDRLSFLEKYKLSFYHGKYTHDLGRSLFSMYGSSSQLIDKKGLIRINLNVSSDFKHGSYDGFVSASYFSLGLMLPTSFSSNRVYIVSEDGVIYGEGYLSNLRITDRFEGYFFGKKQSSRVFYGYFARVKTFENYTSKQFYLIQVINGRSFKQLPVVIHTT